MKGCNLKKGESPVPTQFSRKLSRQFKTRSRPAIIFSRPLNPSRPWRTCSEVTSRPLCHNPLAILGVSNPVLSSTEHQECVQSTVQEAGPHDSLNYRQISSPFAVAVANGIGLCKYPIFLAACAEDANYNREMILNIDYTKIALTIFLYQRLNPVRTT